MSRSESLMQVASNAALNAASAAQRQATAPAPTNSFAKALATAQSASRSFGGSTPSMPTGKVPTLSGPHRPKTPIAPDFPRFNELLSSAANGAAGLAQTALAATHFALPANSEASSGPLGKAQSSISTASTAQCGSAAATAGAIEGAGSNVVSQSPAGTNSPSQTPVVDTNGNGTQPAAAPAAASSGSQFLDSILESLPIVGNVIRLMQGSESHVSPEGVAFAKSGPDAADPAADPETVRAPSSANTAPGTWGPSPNSPSSNEVTSQSAPPLLFSLKMPELPAVHESSAVSGVPPKNATGTAARSVQPAFVATPSTADQTTQQSISDARSTLAQNLGARMQAELAPAKSEPGADTTSSGNQQGAADDSARSLSQTAPVNASTPTKSSGASAAGTDSTVASASVPASSNIRELAESATYAAKGVAPLSGSAVSGAASEGAFAQAVSTAAGAAAQQSPAPLPQNPSATGANAVPQPLPTPQAELQNSTNSMPAVANSEMRVAMQTDLLGTIDLRAAIHQSTLTATIGVQRDDVQTLLANELPALQHALAEKNLQVAQISVLNHSGGGTFDPRNSPHDPRRHQPNHQPVFTMPNVHQIGSSFGDEGGGLVSDSYAGSLGAGRLSVLA
jgi:Flagellar hook-length control protein FliK